MSLRVRIAGLIAVAAALTGLPAGVACATPGLTGEVVKALALPVQPTDFVILVDNSTSMAKGRPANAVRSALSQLLKIMQPTDRLALYSFDSAVTAQYRGLVGDQASWMLGALPKATVGWSDQGAALEAAVTELARDAANPQAVVVMLTDSSPDPAPGSDYQSQEGKAWRELAENGRRLVGQRPVASYLFGLSSRVDATMLGRALPTTQQVTASEMARAIGSIGSDLERLRAGRLLSDELRAPIAVGWAGDFSSGSTGWLPIRVTVESPYPHVPVVLRGLRVAAAGELTAEVSGLPKVIELAPGQTKILDAQVQLSGDGDLRDLSLTFDAAVDSPWRPALTAGLGLTFEPKLVTVAGPRSDGALARSLPTVVTVGGLLGLSVVVWWLGSALISPRMRGELIFSRHAEEIARVRLRGRRQYLAGVPGAGALATLGGAVYGARPVRGHEREVRVDLVAGRSWSRGVIQDGHVIQMGDMEIAYSSVTGAILRPALVH